MSQNFHWICPIMLGGILTVQAGLFVSSAPAGQLNSTPPVASGPGLGFANVAAILTSNANNDDSPGPQPDNNLVLPLLRFDSAGYIDIRFTVTPTAGVTEYQVSESVDNNTGSSWNAYTMMLGFGIGAGFTQVGGIGDGLDFDTGPPGGNTTPPTSTVMPTVTRPNEDTLVFSGGTQGSSAQQYEFRIDVSDLISRNETFTLRQQPVTLLGDYNHNGIVDAADYVVWRKSDGSPAGYTLWRTNFGQSAGGGSGAGMNTAVPEPAPLLLLLMGILAMCARNRATVS